MSGSAVRVQDFGVERVEGCFRTGSGFWVQGLGPRVWGSGFRV